MRPNFITYLIFFGPISSFIFGLLFVPIIANVWYSFHRWQGVGSEPIFVGLENYIALFSDSDFLLTLFNVARYVSFILPLVVLVPLFLAVTFQQDDKWSKIVRSVVIFPFAFSMVVEGVLWRWVYQPHVGPASLLKIDIIGNYATAIYGVAFVAFWQAMGFYMYMFLAGIGSIDTAFYESAKIDGASSLQIFRYITLPLLKPTLAFVVTMALIWNIQTFDPVFVVTHGGPGFSTLTPVFYVYWLAFNRQDIGYASTVAVILLIITLIIASTSLKLFQRGE
jgi:ABC-type sugar transport system permease subunit